MLPNHWNDKYLKINSRQSYIRSNYEHRSKNSNKEIDLVYLTIFIVGAIFRYYFL